MIINKHIIFTRSRTFKNVSTQKGPLDGAKMSKHDKKRQNILRNVKKKVKYTNVKKKRTREREK